jgi:hypothetical protein
MPMVETPLLASLRPVPWAGPDRKGGLADSASGPDESVEPVSGTEELVSTHADRQR